MKPQLSPSPQNPNAIELEGKVIAVRPGTMFRVQLANGHMVLGHISGKLRKHPMPTDELSSGKGFIIGVLSLTRLRLRQERLGLNGPNLGILRLRQRNVLTLPFKLALRGLPILFCRAWPPALLAPDFKSSAGDVFVSDGRVGRRHRKRRLLITTT